MYACKSLKMQGNLCIEFYAQKCERHSIGGRRIFIGFPDKFAKSAFYAGLVSLDFTGDNRRGAPQRSNQSGDCCSTQKSVHKSGNNAQKFTGFPVDVDLIVGSSTDYDARAVAAEPQALGKLGRELAHRIAF
jgi:hypothetical protein